PAAKDRPCERRAWLAPATAVPFLPLAGELVEVSSPITNPASTRASKAEKAALRVAFDAPLSMTARWTASTIAAKPWQGIVMVERSSLIGLNPPTYADKPLCHSPASACGPVNWRPRRNHWLASK